LQPAQLLALQPEHPDASERVLPSLEVVRAANPENNCSTLGELHSGQAISPEL
jgi:hypothetical protein